MVLRNPVPGNYCFGLFFYCFTVISEQLRVVSFKSAFLNYICVHLPSQIHIYKNCYSTVVWENDHNHSNIIILYSFTYSLILYSFTFQHPDQFLLPKFIYWKMSGRCGAESSTVISLINRSFLRKLRPGSFRDHYCFSRHILSFK